MIGYVKLFDSNKKMSFKVNNNRLLKKYTKTWERVSILVNTEFHSEPAHSHNDKYIKAKIKSYADKVNRNFQGNSIPKENASYQCFSLIILNYVIRVSKKNCPQILVEECKYEIQKTKMENLINDDLEPGSLSVNESDNESDNETESDKNE